MKNRLILAVAVLATSGAAQAESFGKPCTAQPREKWLALEQIEKIVTDHGYKVAKSKIKGSCVEVYAHDPKGQRVELFLDPATGNPANSDWINPTKQAG
jgi:hypothetical protein